MSCSWLKIEMRCAAGRRNEPLYAGVAGTGEGALQRGSCAQRKRRRCQSRYHPDVWSEEETTVLHCVFDNATCSK